MKIGLIRHFKVKHPYPDKKYLSHVELAAWFKDYDHSEVEVVELDLGNVDWQICYSSDMPRAIATANETFVGEVILKKELREVAHPDFSKLWKGRLHFMLWAVLVRISWLLGHRAHTESREDVMGRISEFLDDVTQKSERNILVIGHGMLMIEMIGELRKRGFLGPKVSNPKNGKLYIYEKNTFHKK